MHIFHNVLKASDGHLYALTALNVLTMHYQSRISFLTSCKFFISIYHNIMFVKQNNFVTILC